MFFVDFCHRETHPVLTGEQGLGFVAAVPTNRRPSQQQAGLGFGKHPGFQG